MFIGADASLWNIEGSRRQQSAIVLRSKSESRLEFDEELGQLSLAVRLRLLKHPLEMHPHCREPDA